MPHPLYTLDVFTDNRYTGNQLAVVRHSADLDDDAMQKAYDRMGELQDQIEAAEGWELDRHIEQAMHALGCPPGESPVTHLSGSAALAVRPLQYSLNHFLKNLQKVFQKPSWSLLASSLPSPAPQKRTANMW